MNAMIIFMQGEKQEPRLVDREYSYEIAWRFINFTANLGLEATVKIVTEDRISIYSSDGVGSITYIKQPARTKAEFEGFTLL